jgi:plasmid stabilization system protein ParE
VTLQIRVSFRARQDVEKILSWLSARSLPGAARWFDKYIQSLHSLATQAANCSQAPEASILGYDVRQLLFKTRKGHTYRTVFIIEGDCVQVLAVRGSGQDLLTSEELGLEE